MVIFAPKALITVNSCHVPQGLRLRALESLLSTNVKHVLKNLPALKAQALLPILKKRFFVNLATSVPLVLSQKDSSHVLEGFIRFHLVCLLRTSANNVPLAIIVHQVPINPLYAQVATIVKLELKTFSIVLARTAHTPNPSA